MFFFVAPRIIPRCCRVSFDGIAIVAIFPDMPSARIWPSMMKVFIACVAVDVRK
jgi:hypothetical protein